MEAGERLPVDHGASLKTLAKKDPALENEDRAILLARMQPAGSTFA
ncbi:hypothetical protein EMIT0357P_10149 [Pseudomonas marginalis]